MTETMTQVELSEDEAMILRETLERFLSDLRMEIANTDSKEWRDALKHRKLTLMKIIEMIA